MIEIKIEGIDVLKRRLNNLTKKVQRKIIRQAVRESLKPILKSAKTNAKALSRGGDGMGKLIAKNLKVKPFRKQRRGQYGMSVRIMATKEAAKKSSGSAKGFYAFMEMALGFTHVTKSGKRYYIPSAIEYGHAFPGRGGSKNAPKDVPAKPFMRPAMDTNKQKVQQIFADVMGKGIEREARSVG